MARDERDDWNIRNRLGNVVQIERILERYKADRFKAAQGWRGILNWIDVKELDQVIAEHERALDVARAELAEVRAEFARQVEEEEATDPAELDAVDEARQAFMGKLPRSKYHELPDELLNLENSYGDGIKSAHRTYLTHRAGAARQKFGWPRPMGASREIPEGDFELSYWVESLVVIIRDLENFVDRCLADHPELAGPVSASVAAAERANLEEEGHRAVKIIVADLNSKLQQIYRGDVYVTSDEEGRTSFHARKHVIERFGGHDALSFRIGELLKSGKFGDNRILSRIDAQAHIFLEEGPVIALPPPTHSQQDHSQAPAQDEPVTPPPAPDGLTDEEREILDRYDLSLPIDGTKIPGMRIKYVGRVPPDLVDQVNADFDVIDRLAS